MADAALDLVERHPTTALRVGIISLHTSPLADLGRGGNGGMNVYVREVARALSLRGLRSDVFTRAERAVTEQAIAERSRLIPIPVEGDYPDKYALLDAVPLFASRVVDRARERGPYDLLYSHYWLSGAVAELVAATLGVPWLHMAHTLGTVKNRSLAQGSAPEPLERIQVERGLAKHADVLVASTEAERDDLVRDYGAESERVAVVPPGVDLSMFATAPGSPPLQAPYVLFVGRLEPLKGAHLALRAFARVSRRHPMLSLIVVGDDASGHAGERRRLAELASELGIAGSVVFTGTLPQPTLARYYAHAVACLVPSYSESFGLVALEAQASGCPVIASDLPGLASIVRDGITGHLVCGDDPGRYTELLEALLDEPDRAELMGRRATLLAQRFTWARTADALIDEMLALRREPAAAALRADG